MIETKKEVIKKIESIISADLRPYFLAIAESDDGTYINIIITAPCFVLMTMQERVNKVLEVLNNQAPDIVQNNVIMIQAFCAEELKDLFDYWL